MGIKTTETVVRGFRTTHYFRNYVIHRILLLSSSSSSSDGRGREERTSAAAYSVHLLSPGPVFARRQRQCGSSDGREQLVLLPGTPRHRASDKRVRERRECFSPIEAATDFACLHFGSHWWPRRSRWPQSALMCTYCSIRRVALCPGGDVEYYRKLE